MSPPQWALGLAVVGLLAACGGPETADPAPPPLRLEATVGSEVTLDAGTGTLPTVLLLLPEANWVRLVARQHGLDVALKLRSPDGAELMAMDSPTGGRGREWLGFVTPSAGEYRLELERFSGDGEVILAVEELRPAAPGDVERAEGFRRLAAGVAHWIAERRTAAAGELAAAEAAFARAGSDPAVVDAQRWRAAVLAAGGELERADRLYVAAAAGYRQQGDGWSEGRVLTERGRRLRQVGRTEEAETALLRALALLTAEADDATRSVTLHNLGRLWQGVGRLTEAEEALDQALELRRALGRTCEAASSQGELGLLHARVGRDAEALDLLSEAWQQSQGCSAERRIAAGVALGWALYLAGEPEAALHHLSPALDLASAEGETQDALGALDRRGTVLSSMGRYAESEADYRRALDLVRGTGERLSEGHVLSNLGRLARRSGDAEAACGWLSEALPVLVEAGDAEGEAFTRLELARLECGSGGVEDARRHLETAIERVEGVRRGLDGVFSRGVFLSHRREIYAELIDLWMERHRREPQAGHSRRALAVAERARARGLLDSVGAGAPSGGLGGGAEFLAEVRRLDAERERLAAAGAPPAAGAAVDRQIRRLALEAERPPPPGEVPRQPLDAEGLVSLLDGRTQMLVYWLGPRVSRLWLVEPEGRILAFELPREEVLAPLVERSVAALAAEPRSRLVSTHEVSLAALSRGLLGEVAPYLRGPRLVVVPDGALWSLPFGALPWPGGTERLLDRFPVTTLPSPSALAVQRRSPLAAQPQAPVVVFADPVFGAADPRLAGGAAGGSSEHPPALRRAVADLGLAGLPRLRQTRAEAVAIAHLGTVRPIRVVTGFRATRQRLVDLPAGGVGVLHLATHALLHPVHPQLSGVVLSMVDEAGRPRDGFLRAWEIAGLDLPVEMVVLSACSTGLGRQVRGEGLIGLPQAFFRAGARRVVVSHWPVDDAATAVLMAAFHRGVLVDGLEPAAALAAAQRQVRARPEWTAPYYWAGFSQQGEWRALPSDP